MKNENELDSKLVEKIYTLVDAKRGKCVYDIDLDEANFHVETNDPNMNNQHYYLIDHSNQSVSAFYVDTKEIIKN